MGSRPRRRFQCGGSCGFSAVSFFGGVGGRGKARFCLGRTGLLGGKRRSAHGGGFGGNAGGVRLPVCAGGAQSRLDRGFAACSRLYLAPRRSVTLVAANWIWSGGARKTTDNYYGPLHSARVSPAGVRRPANHGAVFSGRKRTIPAYLQKPPLTGHNLISFVSTQPPRSEHPPPIRRPHRPPMRGCCCLRF